MVGLKPHGSSVAGAVGLSGHLSKLLIDTGVVKLWTEALARCGAKAVAGRAVPRTCRAEEMAPGLGLR